MIEYYIHTNPQITFTKEIYKRHEKVYTSNKVHNFVNNRVVIEKNNEMELIYNMWIDNIDNINNIYFFIVKKIIDPNTITCDTRSDKENLTIQFISKIGRDALKTLNNFIYKTSYTKYEKNNIMELPFFKKKITNGIFDNHYFLILIDSVNADMNKLNVSYMVSYSQEEINRYRMNQHEYLIKKVYTEKYDIKIGENVVEFNDTLNIACILINAPPNSKLDIKLRCIKKIDDNNEKLLVFDMKSTQCDPQYFDYVSDKYDTYAFDVYSNLMNINENQPYGLIVMKDASHFFINSSNDCSIEISYITFDVMHTELDKIWIATQYIRPRPLPHIVEEVVEDVDEDVDEVNNIPFDNQLVTANNHSEIKYLSDISLHIVLTYEKKHAIRRSLSKDVTCIIDWDTIKYGGYYYMCSICKITCEMSNYKKWVATHHSVKCPHCNVKFSNYPQLYVNAIDYLYYPKLILNRTYDMINKTIGIVFNKPQTGM